MEEEIGRGIPLARCIIVRWRHPEDKRPSLVGPVSSVVTISFYSLVSDACIIVLQKLSSVKPTGEFRNSCTLTEVVGTRDYVKLPAVLELLHSSASEEFSQLHQLNVP